MIDVGINSRDLDRFLKKFKEQAPFAISTAINETLKDAQKVQRAHQRRVFNGRRKNWVDKSVKIKPFANKRTIEGSILIDPPGGQQRADILTKFEGGGTKTATGGNLAIPNSGARVPRNKPGRSGPRSLNIGRDGRGDKRTYLVKNVGIFRRTGKGKRSRGKLLYALKKSVRIPSRLDFVRNVTRVVNRRFERHLLTALDRAIRTAK